MINSSLNNNDTTVIFLGTRKEACNQLSDNLTVLWTRTRTLWMKLNVDEISIDEEAMPVLNKHGWMTETKTSWIVWRIKAGEEQQLHKRLKMNWHFVRPGGKVLKTYLCTGALRFTSRWKDNIYKLTSVVGTHLRQMYKILVLLLT